jgi:hypothetical protein
MNITQLTVVNECLASMGEEPINSLAEDNAFVNSANFAFENANLNEQSVGWWFNKESILIRPDTKGEYVVPSDVIDLWVDANPRWLAVRSSRLYDTSKGERLVGTAPQRAEVMRLLAFDDLPLIMKRVVKAATVLQFQKSYDGDAQKIKDAKEEYAFARQTARTQHIRAVGANFSTRAENSMYSDYGRLRTPR